LKFNEVDWTVVVKKVSDTTRKERAEAFAIAKKEAEAKAIEAAKIAEEKAIEKAKIIAEKEDAKASENGKAQ